MPNELINLAISNPLMQSSALSIELQPIAIDRHHIHAEPSADAFPCLVLQKLIDDAMLAPFRARLLQRLTHLSFATPEVVNESQRTRHSLLCLMPNNRIKAVVTLNRFPTRHVIDTYAHLMQRRLYLKCGITKPVEVPAGVVFKEPSSSTRVTRRFSRDWLTEAFSSSVAHQNGSDLRAANRVLPFELLQLEPVDFAQPFSQSMLIHRCLAVDRSLLYLLIACMCISLRETLMSFPLRAEKLACKRLEPGFCPLACKTSHERLTDR